MTRSTERLHPSPDLWMSNVGIKSISVEQLFGQFSYCLREDLSPRGETSRLLLLYGENGTGKTTILKMLFYLLSPIDNKGHKSKIRRVRFKRFDVELGDGTHVIAERQNNQENPYELRIVRAGQVLGRTVYGALGVKPSLQEKKALFEYYERERAHDSEHEKLLSILESLNLRMIWLTDRRDVYSTVPDLNKNAEEEEVEVSNLRIRHIRPVSEAGQDESERNVLSRAVEQISWWATRQAFKGSAQGEEDVNAVYADIVNRIAQTDRSRQYTQSDFKNVITVLRQQENRGADFIRFGLIKPPKVHEIIKALTRLRPAARAGVVTVLEPYIASLTTRLNALDPIRKQLAAFVDTMNSFYRNKSVSLDVNKGMVILSSNGERLTPAMLSSGERQLLFLLSSTVVARERATLFMIDEPELSLNVKWQRQLLRSLLDITRDSHVQFVCATHSIELLTRYSQFVLDLESIHRKNGSKKQTTSSN